MPVFLICQFFSNIILITRNILRWEYNGGYNMKNKILTSICLTFFLFLTSPMTLSAQAYGENLYDISKENNVVINDGVEYKIEFLDYHDFFTEEEIYMLQKLTMAEAGNQTKNCQLMVAETVLNRVDSNLFPNTIKEVIFQRDSKKYQFSCVPDGNYEKAKPTEQVKEAVDEALFNYVNGTSKYSSDMLYFNSIGYFSWAIDYYQDGAMYFSLQRY